MRTVLINGRVLTGDLLRDDVAVVLDDDRIAQVVPAGAAPDGARVDLDGGTLLPGFIDTQVNGGGGVLFNDEPTVEGVAAIAAAHRRFGTTGFLPTLISDDLSVIDRAMRAVEAAIEQGVPGVLGIHIEGPYLSARRRGIHSLDHLRDLDEEGVTLLTSLARGRTLVTVAPEAATPAMIERLAAAGVVVAIGHTNAGYEEARRALDAGATGVTHLFNAMSQLGNREPGVVGAALDDPDCWCGLIVDGRHVHDATLKIALRARPLDRFMLVTDAMPSVGMTDKVFALNGRRITVQDGVCMDEHGTLAGADLDMASAVRNAVERLGLTLAQAAFMAAAAPAAFMGLADQRGRIEAGLRADLVLLDRDGRAVRTWIGGQASSS
ncbi:MAG: N-acetylglucosamine-6-phosphate deacetylase [Brevundimonas sp.]